MLLQKFGDYRSSEIVPDAICDLPRTVFITNFLTFFQNCLYIYFWRGGCRFVLARQGVELSLCLCTVADTLAKLMYCWMNSGNIHTRHSGYSHVYENLGTMG